MKEIYVLVVAFRFHCLQSKWATWARPKFVVDSHSTEHVSAELGWIQVS